MQIESDIKAEKTNKNQNSISPELLHEHQLDINRIMVHHTRILQALNNKINTTISVMGACTTSNGGILSWKLVTRILSSTFHPTLRKYQKSSMNYWRENFLVTCIPAAGAASRFFGELQKFIFNLEAKIPELKKISHIFNNKLNQIKITPERRKEIQSIIINTKVSSELSSLSEFINSHYPDNIKEISDNLFKLISKVIYKGEFYFISNESKKSKDKYTKFFLLKSESFTRKPWEYLNLNYKDIPKNEFNESTNENSHFDLGNQEESILKTYAISCILLQKYGFLPKALIPTTIEGDSFLMLKIVEQIKLFPCLGNILVVPTNMKKKFEQKINELTQVIQENSNDIFSLRNSPFAPSWLKNSTKKIGGWTIFEQGRDLSTIRFNMDGTPFQDDDGKYTPISAGHGELIHLFNDIANKYPAAECIHIRNIDNIIGSSTARSDELNIPAEAFKLIRDCLEYLRTKVEDFLFEEKNKSNALRLHDESVLNALNYLANFINEDIANKELKECYDAENKFLGVSFKSFHKIIGNLFHWQNLSSTLSDMESWEQILSWMELPISVFGVVRKEVLDIGGGPIFAELPDGTKIKLCIEMPHTNEKDAIEYFGPRGKATHFNPVLAFFELRTNKKSFENENSVGKKVNYSKLFDERFWLLSKREYKGKPVCYHETVLHELIGNSATTNLIFIEVPRSLFKPHKSYFDSLGNDRRSYGFDETLATTETRSF